MGHGWGRARPKRPERRACWVGEKEKGVGLQREGHGGTSCTACSRGGGWGEGGAEARVASTPGLPGTVGLPER